MTKNGRKKSVKSDAEVSRQAKEDQKKRPLREPDGTVSLEERRTCETPPKKYKWRIVLRGDNVKDEERLWAVFTEQGTSASQMAGVRFLDTI